MLKVQILRYGLLKYDRNPGEFVPGRVAVPLRQASLLHLAVQRQHFVAVKAHLSSTVNSVKEISVPSTRWTAAMQS